MRASGIGNLNFQQLLFAYSLSIFLLVKLKFSAEVFFPNVHDNTHAISVLLCKSYGSLRTVAKQISVNMKDLCDTSFILLRVVNTPLLIA